MNLFKKLVPFLVIILSVFIYFYPFVLSQKLPIPADTIVGLYYPFRDLYAKTNPNGLPYKNFLITDPVRQQYPWKNLVISLEKQMQLPLWNPYEMAGTPLLANFQSSPYYPLNILYFLLPFSLSWSILILIQPLLAGLFLYMYLRHLRLDTRAAILGAITWMFCGFSIAWLEWGTIISTCLWLPLLLLSVDKIVGTDIEENVKFKVQNAKIQFKSAKYIWSLIFVLGISTSFFAGHLQAFFYLFLFTVLYIIFRIFGSKQILVGGVFLLCFLIFTFLTSFQWIPTLRFIMLSNRSLDQSYLQAGWFIPYENLFQFIAPDFFGNPATLNYFGIWNYAEFVGYVGIVSLVMALYALIMRHDKKTWFYLGLLFIALVFALPNPIANLPFVLHLPFLSSAQPTRLLFIVDFCLSVLAALGLDRLIQNKSKVWVPIVLVGLALGFMWEFMYMFKAMGAHEMSVAQSNLKLPTIVFFGVSVLLMMYQFIKNTKVRQIIIPLIIIVVLFDLLRFGWKFTPFVSDSYIYPSTRITSFLQNQKGQFRIATTDNRILPPNFSIMYKLQSIEGYDPLYLSNYATLIAANEREDHSIKQPFGFNRIITPRNLNSQIIDLLNVKYVLSLSDMPSEKFEKVFQDGETRIYKNKQVFPRAFFVENTITTRNESDAAQLLFTNDLSKNAIVVNPKQSTLQFSVGSATVSDFSPSMEIIKTQNNDTGFLVVSDVYYPAFHATIDGQETEIVPVDLAFRGIVVPGGKHTIMFEPKLF